MEHKVNLIQIGIITSLKGTDGEIVLSRGTDGIFLPVGVTVHIGFSQSFTSEYTLSHPLSITNNRGVVKLVGITTVQAVNLRECAVFANRSDILKYSNIKYLHSDIIDCNVIDVANNSCIGKVVEVWHLPANDVWLVDTNRGELPLPVIDDVIKQVDITNKQIYIHIIDGLWDIVSTS